VIGKWGGDIERASTSSAAAPSGWAGSSSDVLAPGASAAVKNGSPWT
jgi:hypothetical protein